MVGIEAATLAMAKSAGIDVPNFKVQTLGESAALLLERFDMTAEGGRQHVLSMKTLLDVEQYYYLGYSDMAEVLRQVSDHPEKDLPALYRQTVFNALIANTDDHLKNFAMLRGDDGWQLTPAYDLLPDVANNREHVLHFGVSGNKANKEALQKLGKSFGLSPQKTRRIIDQVMQAVSHFPEQCATYHVADEEVTSLMSRFLKYS